ncbi:CarD family transcriptional regulator [Maledivibacter halophilus]|uniref:Transcriptional regulator, CarD family n=1 Tax=Maledivibacter halophilus TaxID=36842 RepID=A0A1T5MI78_9FIRM|nr:CarD family transcriptional regulator [Maledivibacter halophilus]SKC87937.1 transcriptional regulator, CarD family [Maledivibacter halophilus]
MFNIGDKVVYPMHGAGIIKSIEEKEILGEKRKYYILLLPLRNMKVMIPLDNVDTMGLRDIISEQEVEQVLAVLNDDESKMPKNWNRRYRANMDKIKSGDIYEVAGVVRNLMLRDKEKGLSTGERKMLNNAKQILISELVLVNDSDELSIEELINETIQ